MKFNLRLGILYLILALCLVLPATFSQTEIKLENRSIDANVSENPSGLVGIMVNSPLVIPQGNRITQPVLTLRNNMENCFMEIVSISPTSSSYIGYSYNIQPYSSGFFSPNQEAIIIIQVLGGQTGTYFKQLTIEICWVDNQGKIINMATVTNVTVEILVV